MVFRAPMPRGGTPNLEWLQYLSQALLGLGGGIASGRGLGEGIGLGVAGAQQGLQQAQEQRMQRELYDLEKRKLEQGEEPSEKLRLAQEAWAAAGKVGMPDFSTLQQYGVVPEPADAETPTPFGAFYQQYQAEHGSPPSLDVIQQWHRAQTPQTSITLKNYGDIPQGMRLVEGPEGVSMEPVPGGPVAEAQAGEKARKERVADIVTGKVDEALGIVEQSKRMGGDVNLATGVLGAASQNMPTAPAYQLNATIETIKANLGFDALQEMRNLSKTGGALGQVAIPEIERLESAIANLRIGQGEEQLTKNLKQVREHYSNVVTILGQIRQQPGARPATPETMTDEELKRQLGIP